MTTPHDVTGLLRDLSRGADDALDRLVPVLYDELRRIAHGQLRRERPGHTLSTTALVHEAYLKLVNIRDVAWQDRVHFFAMAARVMRRVLVDYARARGRAKRGGDARHVPLSDAADLLAQQPDDLLDLDDAIARLARVSERQCRVVECRCFAGMSVEETAEALGASVATIKRDWVFARAWLNRELRSAEPAG